MPIAGPEPHPHRKKERTEEHNHVKDPIHDLVETLRDEFQRGHLLQKGLGEAAKRRRIVISIVSLLVLAGFILIAVVTRGAIHLRH
jgi:hypothetical protein